MSGNAQAVEDRGTNWETVPIEQGLAILAGLWDEAERASKILNQRTTGANLMVSCIMENSSRRPSSCVGQTEPSKAAFSRVRENPETHTFETLYCCSATCHTAYLMGVQSGEFSW